LDAGRTDGPEVIESLEDLDRVIAALEDEMKAAAADLAFERAAEIRDRIASLRKRMVFENR
jgi:excinuclease ABC subunit B